MSQLIESNKRVKEWKWEQDASIGLVAGLAGTSTNLNQWMEDAPIDKTARGIYLGSRIGAHIGAGVATTLGIGCGLHKYRNRNRGE